MEKYYTYLWLREDGTPYYVGKGCGRRMYEEHTIGKCPSKDRIIVQYFESEEDALFAEKFLILYFGRKDLGTGILRNYSDGGEGASNPSISSRGKRGRALKGREFSKETRTKLSLASKGKAKSEEHCNSIRRVKLQGQYYKLGISGHRGISWDRTVSKWVVRKSCNGKRIYLGLYSKLEDAIKALTK